MAVTTDLQQQVFELLSRASNVSFVTADEVEGSGGVLSPGQRVSAEVIAMLPNNRAQVKVGSERFNLEMPKMPVAVKAGQLLEMTFVSNDPRATFAIARQAGLAPPVSLSEASRLLSMLISNEQVLDPKFRSSLQNVGDILRRASGDAGVLANLMDDALTYGINRDGYVKPSTQTPGDSMQDPANKQANQFQHGAGQTSEQTKLALFETNAAQVLRSAAQNSKFTLVEATNLLGTALPFMPGEEVDASVIGTLPGGRVFLQVAGTSLEMLFSQSVKKGDILRLTYITSEPKLIFALPRIMPDNATGILSEAGKWLSVLEHSKSGISEQQMYVLERLNTVLKSLPTDSPAFTAIRDEPMTYQAILQGRAFYEQGLASQAALLGSANPTLTHGNGIVLSDDMAKLLQAIIKGDRLALLESLNQQSQASGFAQGQQLKGEVLAVLGGGRFMVQVAGKNMEFLMPKGVSRGDIINLFFITDEPHHTFLMVRFGQAGDSKVSDTGRWLGGFLTEAAGEEPVASQATTSILKTLLSGPPTDAELLARSLQKGLSESGLFYESHLARWFGGEYSLEDILKEPQGLLSRRLKDANLNQHITNSQGASAQDTEDIIDAIVNSMKTDAKHEGIADARLHSILGEQLSALQHSQLMFRGYLFDGQPIGWKIFEREKGRGKSGERERSWETSISITLPNIGEVSALLALDGEAISVKISAGKEDSVIKLDAGKIKLLEQLESARLKLVEMSVIHAAK